MPLFLMKRVKPKIEDQKSNNYSMPHRKNIIGSYLPSCRAVSKNISKNNSVSRNVL